MSGALTYPTKQSYWITSATMNSSGLFLSSFEPGILKYTGTNVVPYGNIPNPVVSLSKQYALDNMGQIWNIGTSSVVNSGLPTGYGILQSTPNGLYMCGPSGIYDVSSASVIFSSGVSFARFESGQGYFGGQGYYGVMNTSGNQISVYPLPFECLPIDGIYDIGIIGCASIMFGSGSIAAYVDNVTLMFATQSNLTVYSDNTFFQHSISASSSIAICPFSSSSGYAIADAGNQKLILQNTTIDVPGLEPFIAPSSDYSTVVVATSGQARAYSVSQELLNINLPGTFVAAQGVPNYSIILATSGAIILNYAGFFDYTFFTINQSGNSAAISPNGEFLISNNGTLYLFEANGNMIGEYPVSAGVEIFAY